MKVGELFIYRKNMSIHHDVDGCIGIVLESSNKYGQYKAKVGHKTLWVTSRNMEEV
jgi:hypothetical protein